MEFPAEVRVPASAFSNDLDNLETDPFVEKEANSNGSWRMKEQDPLRQWPSLAQVCRQNMICTSDKHWQLHIQE